MGECWTMLQNETYEGLIKSIQRKKTLLIVVTIIIAITTIVLSSPIYIQIADQVVVEQQGLPSPITMAVLAMVLGLEWFISLIIHEPLRSSLDQECDPHKFLILNRRLAASRALDAVNSVGLLYSGQFAEAIFYADRIIANKKGKMKLSAYFNKARCLFFLGNMAEMKNTVAQFTADLKEMNTRNQRVTDTYAHVFDSLQLMCAIADGDTKQIELCRNKASVWSNSKMTEGFIDYLKGVAAYLLKDNDEAVYRFRSVCEHCSKTVLGKYASNYLNEIQGQQQ